MLRFCIHSLVILLLMPRTIPAQDSNTPEVTDQVVSIDPEAAVLNQRYWIVSSRNCPQVLSRMRNCRLDVWAVDTPASLVPVPVTETATQFHRCDAGEAEFQHALAPGVPVCIFVHGSYVDWPSVVKYSRESFQWLNQADPDRPVQCIFYTWPSDPITYVPQLDFNELGDRAALNGFYLSRVIRHIPVECPVSLIGHSHGSSIVGSATHLLGGGQLAGYCLPAGTDRGHRIHIVLAAAAIDQQWFNPGERYGRSLQRTEAILNLVNHRDWALGFYHLRFAGSGRSVARYGFRPVDYQLMGPFAERIHQLDVTNTIGRDHTWPNYYAIPALANSIAPYVYFTDTQAKRPVKVLTPPQSSQTRFAGGEETFQRAVSK